MGKPPRRVDLGGYRAPYRTLVAAKQETGNAEARPEYHCPMVDDDRDQDHRRHEERSLGRDVNRKRNGRTPRRPSPPCRIR
jgi:hypothetical protein